MIGQVASTTAAAVHQAPREQKSTRPEPAPKESSPPPKAILGVGARLKPGHSGGTGTQGPAPGIQSPTKVEVSPKSESRNLKANNDGSIQFATGARIDTKVVTSQKTVDPKTPLKTRAESMRGQHVDVRG